MSVNAELHMVARPLCSALIVCWLQPLTPMLFPGWLSSPELAALVLSPLETQACSGQLVMAILSVLDPFSPRYVWWGVSNLE